jgi:signal transduction histidine kinase
MRNPLSAMLLCADSIAEALLDFQATRDKTTNLSDALVENNLDAAQTIVLCAQHQKRIIDDVLTLSKLNSTMLHVTPVQVEVETTLRRTLKMFENEFVAHDIQISFDVEDSYRNAKIDLVFCDPVRLTQIFINLLTNVCSFWSSFLAVWLNFGRLSNLLAPNSEKKYPSRSAHPFPVHLKVHTLTSNGSRQKTHIHYKT